ncbi:type II toxin-antitoxin system death-on-curing family toxin [Algirhabdus cladophorae]|uniref:type II toxin-antitoxin system death-on-curing family toxin n=1 Tax=Algirhabdus cladophorae TaxID=3377108 RepID=UPI003B84AFC0
MTAWKWVPLRALLIIHDRQISRHGGASGIRDLSLLEAACAHPVNLANYEDPDVFALGASYAFGISKAHAFVDGNKRTAFVAAFTFLALNSVPRRPDPFIGVRMIEGIASDTVSEREFAEWLRTLPSSDAQ